MISAVAVPAAAKTAASAVTITAVSCAVHGAIDFVEVIISDIFLPPFTYQKSYQVSFLLPRRSL